MSDEHNVSALPEKHGQGAGQKTRYRGCCSCGHRTYVWFSTPEAARTAVRRTHISDINHNETEGATQ